MDSPVQINIFEIEERERNAKAIVDNPVWIEAWQETEKRLFEAFCDTPTNEIEELTQIRLTHSVLVAIKGRIESHMFTGEQMRLSNLENEEDKVI